ncbi:MAG: hypothetical protein KC550_07990 [Nanoarchaeota archaeon]|nr:hypothetical protein [Nanoarchaeota archaeon]
MLVFLWALLTALNFFLRINMEARSLRISSSCFDHWWIWDKIMASFKANKSLVVFY